MILVTVWAIGAFLCQVFGINETWNYAPDIKDTTAQKPMVIIIPSYNNGKLYEGNLDSVFSQKYDNFRVIYTNDASTDNTGIAVKKYVEDHGYADRFTYIENEKNMGASHNVYKMVHLCRDDEVVCVLDGDDKLKHDRVLDRVNRAYAQDDVWMVYAQYSVRRKWHGDSIPLERSMLRDGAFRTRRWKTFGFRTFYAGLYKSIPEEKWLYKGGHYDVAGDVIKMLYLMDLARDHVYFIPESLYLYNLDSPINDSRIRRARQKKFEKYMWSLPPLEKLNSKDEFIATQI
jgi:glycosyltransferase involved in cell wall biosynthesis